MSAEIPTSPHDQQNTNTLEANSIKLTLPKALLLVVGAALVLVFIGYFTYWTSQERKYDLARPGQVVDNKGLDVTAPEEDTSKPIDEAAITATLKFLKDEHRALNSMNPLDPANLSDENLQLVPSKQPSF